MATIISLSLFGVFALIGILHIYWVFGGKWGLSAALPTNTNGENVLSPSPISTMIVALGLIMMGIFVLSVSGLLPNFWPSLIQKWGLLALAAVFIVRAIGDFNYAGFFKKIKTTTFAKFDTKYFTPLCLMLGILLILLHYFLGL
jgi:glucan phosphoethanolaminetransferase (alkaline phosphatase superfamily)